MACPPSVRRRHPRATPNRGARCRRRSRRRDRPRSDLPPTLETAFRWWLRWQTWIKRPRARLRSLSRDRLGPLVDVRLVELGDRVLVVAVQELDVMPGHQRDLLGHALAVGGHHHLDLAVGGIQRRQLVDVIGQLVLQGGAIGATRAVVEDRDPAVLEVVHELALDQGVVGFPGRRGAARDRVVRSGGGRIELVWPGRRRVDMRGRSLVGDRRADERADRLERQPAGVHLLRLVIERDRDQQDADGDGTQDATDDEQVPAIADALACRRLLSLLLPQRLQLALSPRHGPYSPKPGPRRNRATASWP